MVPIKNSVQTRGDSVLIAHLALQSAPAATGTLDADGNGKYETLADDLIVLRLLFGLSRQALVIGAIGGEANRGTAPLIGRYISTLMP